MRPFDNAARIQSTFFALHAQLVREDAAELTELLAGGVAPATVLRFYPLETIELVPRLCSLLTGKREIWEFATVLKKIEEGPLAVLYERASLTTDAQLQDWRAPLFTEASNFNVLADAYRAVEKDRALKASSYTMVRDALLTAADIMFFAERWNHLSELQGFEAKMLDNLFGLISVLPAAKVAA